MLGALNKEQIDHVLASNVVGRIGCYADNKVYVVPITYVYHNDCIIGHSGEGMKIHMLRKNPHCCFEVDTTADMSNWQSVIIQGVFEELHGEEAIDSMKILINRLMPLMISQTAHIGHDMELTQRHDAAQVKAIVYRINPIVKTGRFEKRK